VTGPDTPSFSCLPILVTVDTAIIGKGAVLKTCYWFSRDFDHEISTLSETRIEVRLSPKRSATPEATASAKSDFLAAATDFELRSQVEAKTSSVRELILAKAFAEAGVFEDEPQGVFSDAVEESKPEGLFKVLNSGLF
jgi:His-Xaa-Ser system protein HxsD